MADPTLEQLAFLAGHWRTSDGAGEEVWTTPTATVMVGAARTVTGPDKVHTEGLLIEVRDGGITYVASPSDQQKTPFRLTSIEGRRAVFENPTHDFPQRITYWVPDDGGLAAKVEAREGEGWRGFELRWSRATYSP